MEVSASSHLCNLAMRARAVSVFLPRLPASGSRSCLLEWLGLKVWRIEPWQIGAFASGKVRRILRPEA